MTVSLCCLFWCNDDQKIMEDTSNNNVQFCVTSFMNGPYACTLYSVLLWKPLGTNCLRLDKIFMAKQEQLLKVDFCPQDFQQFLNRKLSNKNLTNYPTFNHFLQIYVSLRITVYYGAIRRSLCNGAKLNCCKIILD